MRVESRLSAASGLAMESAQSTLAPGCAAGGVGLSAYICGASGGPTSLSRLPQAASASEEPAIRNRRRPRCGISACGERSFFGIGVISLAAVAEQKLGGIAVQLVGEFGQAGDQPAHFADQIRKLGQSIALDEGVGIVGDLAEFGHGD